MRLSADEASSKDLGKRRQGTISESPMAEACHGVFPVTVFRAKGGAEGRLEGSKGCASFHDPLENEIAAAEAQCRAMFGFDHK